MKKSFLNEEVFFTLEDMWTYKKMNIMGYQLKVFEACIQDLGREKSIIT